MSDIQRWTPAWDGKEVGAYADSNGAYVLASDAEAAITAARAEERAKWIALWEDENEAGMLAEVQRDALAGLDNAEVWYRIMAVLDRNGINTENGSIHSWRCFDKDRYPEPCSCAAEVVVEIIQAVKGDSD